jgi:L-lactate dehydrogenase complex protein LldF
MGSVLTPAMRSLKEARDLPNACTLNGRCEEVCPVKIPLPGLLRRLREREYREHLTPRTTRFGLALWAFAATRPWLYRLGSRLGVRTLARLGRKRGHIRSLPGAGGWTRVRDLPAPQRHTFMELYQQRKGVNAP